MSRPTPLLNLRSITRRHHPNFSSYPHALLESSLISLYIYMHHQLLHLTLMASDRMDYYYYYLLLLFLLFISSSSLQISQARDSHFFNKISRPESNSPTSTASSTLVVVEKPVTDLPPQSPNGYGLYDRDSNNFPTTTATTSNYDNNNNDALSSFPNEEFGKPGSDYERREPNRYYYSHDNKGKGKGYYGMSDTRFVENGKYFYDMNAADQETAKANLDRGTYDGRGRRYDVNNGGYGDNIGNGYEYQNNQENLQGSQEDYVP